MSRPCAKCWLLNTTVHCHISFKCFFSPFSAVDMCFPLIHEEPGSFLQAELISMYMNTTLCPDFLNIAGGSCSLSSNVVGTLPEEGFKFAD